ncbi:MAG TPA: UvrD-helicase domain-containing protein, partial [Ktedonobacteraceae bacterium]|nr:UvrD-helicase domain-containing protein [Ktedonobacteraceae bacterium]
PYVAETPAVYGRGDPGGRPATDTRYDEFQRAAIEAPTPALIVAGPGSGKTSTLIGRADYLIHELGVQPQHILALTFSRKAAGEMQERLQTILDTDSIPPTISTFHAFCAELLRTHGNLVGLRQDFTFVDDVEGYFLLRRLAADLPLRHYQNLVAPTTCFPAILGAISRAKDELVSPQAYNDLALRMLEQAHTDEEVQAAEKAREIAEIYALYQERLERQGDTDFGGLIMLAVQLLQEHPEVGSELQQHYQHILVDEFQDINRASGVLLRLLAGEQRNVWVVGDTNQCQPAGTMIRLPDNSECPIEHIQPNSEAVTYDRDSTMFVKKGKVTDVAARPYKGMLYIVKAGDKQTRCTDSHKWLVRWTNTEHAVWITYLMRQGNRYRVGQTQLFLKARVGKRKSNGDLSLALRVRQEKAEAAWILKVHDTLADALVYEQILSAKYGLPEVVFTQSYGIKCFTQEMIDKIYNSLPSLEDAARSCLADHGRKLEYPLYTREMNGVQNGERQRQGRTTIFETQACNLISGFMAIPVAPTQIHSKRDHSMRRVVAESWQPVEVTCEPFSGPVYSLNIAKYHKYIADGLVTCNSIYGFRGASPANIANFKDDYPEAVILPLSRNYRSRPDIVSLAHAFRRERLEPGMDAGESGNVQTARSNLSDAYVTLAVAANEESELSGLVDDIWRKHAQGYSFRDIVVLCRTRAQARKISSALAIADLPVSERGGMLEQESIKNLLSIGMLLAESSGMGILRAARQPDHRLNQNDIETLLLAAREQKCSLIDLILRGEAPIAMSADGSRSLLRLSTILKALWHNTSVWTLLADYLLLETGLVRDLLCAPENPRARALLADYDGILQLARYYDQQQQTLRLQEALARGEDLLQPAPLKEQVKGFLDYLSVLLALRQDGGNRREGADSENSELPDVIRVMTVHASKGLEFPVVYLPFLVTRRFPMQKRAQTAPPPRGMLPPECEGDAAHESGEACLFYVAATRARDQLILSYSERYGKMNYKRSPYIDALVIGLPEERITRLAWEDNRTATGVGARFIAPWVGHSSGEQAP